MNKTAPSTVNTIAADILGVPGRLSRGHARIIGVCKTVKEQ